MRISRLTTTRRVENEEQRQKALAVLKATYQEEKAWVLDAESVFPEADLSDAKISWFLATARGKPVGVLRVVYDPPIEQYIAYAPKPIDFASDINIADFVRNERIAEIGRFAVVPERRNGVGVVLSLMRAATREVVAREYSQLITDVFENDPHSPFGFHTRIVGFRPVATHEIGELRYKGKRITLVLDIKVAYQCFRARGHWFFRTMTRGWTEAMHKRLAT
ncbi:MAG: hypothetical protein RLZ98_2329 [Pseudomonadota bacterium]|jgi:hypothetical protein